MNILVQWVFILNLLASFKFMIKFKAKTIIKLLFDRSIQIYDTFISSISTAIILDLVRITCFEAP